MTALSHNICMVDCNKILNSVCEFIEEIRKEKGWSISDFAKFVEIPRTTVNYWIKKKRMPKIEWLYHMADYFGYSIDYIVGREE